MKIKKLKFILKLVSFTTLFCLILSPMAWSNITSWPDETLQTIRSMGHGSGCDQCTSVLSYSYCVPTCCESCKAEATNQGFQTGLSCNNLCRLPNSTTQADQDIIDECKANGYSTTNCVMVRSIIDPKDTYRRDFERRVNSCNIAVASIKRFCSENHLNKVYPEDLFRLAQDISASPSCDFADVEKYNLISQADDPQTELAKCESSYNECKTFCYDQNVVDSLQTYGPSLVYREGHKAYEDECKPKRARFIQEQDIRNDVIEQANLMAQSCQTAADPTDPGDDPTAESYSASDSGSETAKTNKNPLAKIFESPEIAYQNINGILSAIQPFLPQNKTARSARATVNRSANPTARNYGLTDEEMYGPDYLGYSPEDADELDFAPEAEFDQPKSLMGNTANPNRQNPGMSALGAGGMMGPNGGNSSGQSSSPKRGRASGRKSQKDKTLLGKPEGGSGGSWGAQADDSKKAKNPSNAQPTFNGKVEGQKVFNASKYHNQILASYQKGLNSEAQKRAQRLAAGYSSEDKSPLKARGYSSWHIENKIHPETISLFMQARICYNKKYANGFQTSCALGK